ncbi:MAG TPA: RNA-binding S4 domain-containing protein [Bryobacteraceae bacterium]|nr:RNA-binding S4 domain-containing protein [Bryobacteraceae bacterium]
MRVDKWLWAARFFKTRSFASRACELGRVSLRGQEAKPSREVRIGDFLDITTPAGQFEVEVLLLSEMRGPALVAQGLYRETEASREARLRSVAERRAVPAGDAWREGRPSKRDRRVIERLRGRA